MTAPSEVEALAEQRRLAREEKDYAASDALRAQIAELGWSVKDTPEGQRLTPAPPYPVVGSVADLPDRSGDPDSGRCTVALLVEGWPDDLRTCVEALLAHTPDDVGLVLLENGETDAGAVVHELAADPRVTELHVERAAGWAEARNALLRWDTAPAHVLMDVSTVLEGDALSPLLDALQDADAVGWRGVQVEDGWLSFTDSPPGEVEALLSYLITVRREAAAAVPLPAKARFYRNADMEWSFLLREQGRRLVAVDVPVRQDRHRGYHDSDPVVRDRESKKTYDRFLQRFRGREDLRLPR
ncbi:MAG: hypothetical protein JWM40_452 [Frankiales bacterium]|nr:hypothetical protein [Frankiales bacterium]